MLTHHNFIRLCPIRLYFLLYLFLSLGKRKACRVTERSINQQQDANEQYNKLNNANIR